MSRAYRCPVKQTSGQTLPRRSHSRTRVEQAQQQSAQTRRDRLSQSAAKHPTRRAKPSPKTADQKQRRKQNRGAPLFIKRYVRWLFSKQTVINSRSVSTNSVSNNRGKAALATGSVATLALLIVMPSQVSSQSASYSVCQKVVQSGAEVSRGDLIDLAAASKGTTHDSIRELIDAPYCLLPVPPRQAIESSATAAIDEVVTVREAYPLAFDATAWIVVNYTEGAYAGYDFVFKP